MHALHRWLSRGRVRNAKRRLAAETSARNYAGLAHEHALAGGLDEAHSVALEGLRLFPGDAELRQLADRIRQHALEGRTRELVQELGVAPRAALWRELCELNLESGRHARAEETASEWHRATLDAEAQLYRARARTERFFADRRRDDGRLAFEMCAAAEEALPDDPRPLRLRLDLASRTGAWFEARRAIARLLELFPGDPALEARFRTVLALVAGSRTIEQALRDVERTGQLASERVPGPPPEPPMNGGEATVSAGANGATAADRRANAGLARPILQAVSREPGVRAAFYVRGGTALVQGPKGPTAERNARAVREIVQGARVAARRLGLGQACEVRLEGDFGTLLVAPGELGAGALLLAGAPTRRQSEMLRDLAGIASRAEGSE